MTGDELRFILRDLGMTQKRTAALLGVQPLTCTRWATGAFPIPTSAALVLRFLHGRRVTLDDAEAIRRLYETSV